MSLDAQSGNTQAGFAAGFDPAIAAALSRELHKTAQPLTILQGVLELALMSDSVTNECRVSLNHAAEEVQRLASCFEEVRKLAGLQRAAKDIKTFPLSPLVSDVLRDLSGDLYAAGVTSFLDVRRHDDPMGVAVEASVSRMSTAIRLVLTTLVDCLGAGDEIRISIDGNIDSDLDSEGANAVIRFWPTRYSQSGITKHDLLLNTLTSRLEFARLLLSSVGGELRLNKTPDVVVMILPAAAAQLAVRDGQRKVTHV